MSVIAIILAGINFQYAGPNWRNGFAYYSLPGLEIACILYSFFIGGWGYIAFFKPSYACSLSYAAFTCLSLIFNFCIGIFALVGFNVGFMNTLMGCNQQHFKGVLEIWQGIDSYLQEVSSTLCSDECPCALTNLSAFDSNATTSPFVKDWNISNQGAVAFQNCSQTTQAAAFKKANMSDPYLDPNGSFNQSAFSKYMAKVEDFFQCTGWCNTTFTNPITGNKEPMTRYMFSDINKGPVQHIGCIDSIVNWLPGYLGSYGAITMVLGFVQCALLALLLYQIINKKDELEKEASEPKKEKPTN